MSLLKVHDPNRGPLTLKHDATPRDLSQYSESVDVSLHGDFRYKGWSDRGFQSYRHPARRTKHELLLERKKLHGYPIYSYEERSPEVLDSQADPAVNQGETVRSARGQEGNLSAGKKRAHREDQEQSSSDEDGPQRKESSSEGKESSQERKEPTPENKDSPRSACDLYRQKTWAEQLKFKRQMEEADQDIQKYKKERLAKMQADVEAKKRDLEMLQKYDPFGKPGAGAPLDDPKKQKFLEQDLTPREEVRYKQPQRVPNFFEDSFGLPGCGAPLKTESGNVKADLRGDPSIRFQNRDELRQSIENHIRYHKPQNETQQYNTDLDRQIEEKKTTYEQRKLEELKRDMEMKTHNPYGKPGAGAPNRTISGNRLMVGRKNISLDGNTSPRPISRGTATTDGITHNADNDYYDPWGRGAVQPVRYNDGSVLRHKNHLSNKYAPHVVWGGDQGTSLNMRVTGGAGAPHFNENGHVVTRLPATMKANEFGQNEINEELTGRRRRPQTQLEGKAEVYYPFGLPGAGAPLRDTDGNIITTTNRKVNKEFSSADDRRRVRAAQEYYQDLAKGVEDHERNKKEIESYLKAPVGELASLLGEGQVGKPKRDPVTGMLMSQNLKSSDITQMKIQDFNYRAIKDHRDYHEDLKKAAEERYRSRELEKLKEKQEAKHHEVVFSDFWGRPGAGAPKYMGSNRKANLDDTLFSTRQNMHNSEFERYMGSRSRGPDAEGDSPRSQNYIRSTVKSTHANQYDFENGFKRHPKREYHVAAPWAGNATS